MLVQPVAGIRAALHCHAITGHSRIARAQAADSDRDGRLTGKDAVAFFERSGLPKSELAKVWAFSDSARKGYLDQTAFYKVMITTAAQGRLRNILCCGLRSY